MPPIGSADRVPRQLCDDALIEHKPHSWTNFSGPKWCPGVNLPMTSSVWAPDVPPQSLPTARCERLDSHPAHTWLWGDQCWCPGLPAAPTADMVNHPPHYTSHPSGIECIEVTRHMGFNLGNAVKYIWRADLKNDSIEDLKKAVWYINDEIERRTKQARNKGATS